ncbi:Phosphatidylethanolamine N-methyltransferase [Mycena indigotica]|uniref:Phosphatidylethanolamine N-methyltransferase n=1 Tax=Mycena indigotica TaxID=2126181 RepID=A0A8H6SDB1_9AGAR|nr:Phosphatidylethanolamine N-methyltransferase [Mycena indigotica]KAF7297358.1 Phosphatidylethanolamine N-methyltransferase [Mycena indigotica]
MKLPNVCDDHDFVLATMAGLRQRRTSSSVSDLTHNEPIVEETRIHNEEVVWGKTPGGEVFRVPTTHDVLTLFHPGYPKSHFDLLNLALLGLQLVLFAVLPRSTARVFFLLYFAFWRGAYDAGLGWILTKQSKKKWIVREVQRRGWLDAERRPGMKAWIRKQLVGKMGEDYSFDELPLEYNTWLLFRQVVDVILLNDFVAYCMFGFSCFRVPSDLSFFVHVLRWVAGILMIAFNLWVKTEAHNVVKDYGWYWGDVFFQRGALIFDGVFELAPHPMYSVGYAGYYGLSLICGSYAVLFVSLAGHAAQFAFLVFFENPHIERMYGQRKAIAKRTPVRPRRGQSTSNTATPTTSADTSPELDGYASSTPSITEGETATETDLETEMEGELGAAPLPAGRIKRHQPTVSIASSSSFDATQDMRNKEKPISQHDLFNKYFRRDTIILKNIDLFRANDATLVLIIIYSLTMSLLPQFSGFQSLTLHFVHALSWCLFSCFGLGLILRAQGQNKFLVRHFMKNYHYPTGDARGATIEAFTNWKSLYNLTLCMSYVSFIGLVWQTYTIPNDWTVGVELLRHTIGALLVGLHIWAALECFEVLGPFGWFFGDFFMEDFPTHVEYTGIYRYLNNPEVMGGASWFGLALVTGHGLVLALAVIRHLSHWWFLSAVENPHMQKLYGDSLRKDAGFVKVIKSVATKNARALEKRAGKHAPELKRVAAEVAREVKGTFDKVYEETADVVEEFLAKSRPVISEVMQDTKVLLQQSRERLVITRIANDISSLDATKYKLSAIPASDGHLRYQLGEPIRLKWEAPQNHSRKDWIGIYRIGANKSTLVTRTSSLGMWVPVHDEEWDGDVPLGLGLGLGLGAAAGSSKNADTASGTVTFKSNTLPWISGKYEIRYHHDGKYNVMALVSPIEICVEKPAELTFASVRENLKRVVPLCLDSDPSLIPDSCKTPDMPATPRPKINSIDGSGLAEEEERDPDDFAFWSEQQAKRICSAIKQTFDVEYAPEVVVADANLSALARRIMDSKEVLSVRGSAGS